MVRLLEILIGLFFLLIMLTQVIAPLSTNEPTWPFFRKRAKVEKEIVMAEEEVETIKTEEKLSKIKSEIKEKKNDN